MAIKLTSNYAKRLGLPGYSSHQFSVSVGTELTDLSQVEDEVTRTYRLLQDAVDREIQETGFVPDVEYGLSHNVNLPASNGNSPMRDLALLLIVMETVLIIKATSLPPPAH